METTVGRGGVVFDDSTLTLLKNECSSDPDQEALESLWLPNSSPSFHGSASMMNFEENSTTADQRKLYTQIGIDTCNDDSSCDGCFGHRPEKKRRLSPDQVQFLEKSFEVENKLEPERKVQLAKELGLQPRQVAIWFQNRRARYKTKLLEKEYDYLKSSYDKLKADYDALFKENEKTRNEVNLLTENLISRGARTSDDDDPIISPLKKAAAVAAAMDGSGTSSSKSDVVDSDSPLRHCPPAAADSSSSDYSQDDRVRLGLFVPKFEAEEEGQEKYYDELQPNSCNLGFPVQNQGTWLWQY